MNNELLTQTTLSYGNQTPRMGFEAGIEPGLLNAAPVPEFITINELASISGLPVPVLLDLVEQNELVLFKSEVVPEALFIDLDSYRAFKDQLRDSGRRKFRYAATGYSESLIDQSAVPFSDKEVALLKKAGLGAESQKTSLASELTVTSEQQTEFANSKTTANIANAGAYQAKPQESVKPPIHIGEKVEHQKSSDTYLLEAKDNMASYKLLDLKRVKALLAPFKNAFEIADERKNQIPDYVRTLGIPIVLVNKKDPLKGFRIDLRGACLNRVRIKSRLGKNRVRLDAASLEDSVTEANVLIHKKCQGDFPSLQPRHNQYDVSDEPTLWDALFLSHRANKSNLVRGKIKKTEGRAKGYDDMLKCCGFWSYLLGDMPLYMVDDYFVAECDIEFGMSEYSPSMIHKYFNELRKALKLAKKRGWIQSMPIIPSYPSGRREFIDITPEKHELLKQGYSYAQHAGMANAEFRMAVERTFLDILYYTGQRLSNARSIRLSEIDFQECIWRIPAHNSKADIDFFLPLSEKAMEEIRTLLDLRGEQGITCDYLLSFDNSGELPKIDIQNWRSAAQEAGFPAEFIRHHYRHNFITRLLSKGASIEDVKLVAGMASLGGLARYSHCKVTEVGKNIVNLIP